MRVSVRASAWNRTRSSAGLITFQIHNTTTTTAVARHDLSWDFEGTTLRSSMDSITQDRGWRW